MTASQTAVLRFMLGNDKALTKAVIIQSVGQKNGAALDKHVKTGLVDSLSGGLYCLSETGKAAARDTGD